MTVNAEYRYFITYNTLDSLVNMSSDASLNATPPSSKNSSSFSKFRHNNYNTEFSDTVEKIVVRAVLKTIVRETVGLKIAASFNKKPKEV
jgi:hypothetical protein